ncbi:hypothetical protein ACNKHU_26370 [Shigella flexneri]
MPRPIAVDTNGNTSAYDAALPTEFAGMERFATRKAIVAKLDQAGPPGRDRRVILLQQGLRAIAAACPSSPC